MTDATGTKAFIIVAPAVGPRLALAETATDLANGDTFEFLSCASSP